jgi:hypothetical protein
MHEKIGFCVPIRVGMGEMRPIRPKLISRAVRVRDLLKC